MPRGDIMEFKLEILDKLFMCDENDVFKVKKESLRKLNLNRKEKSILNKYSLYNNNILKYLVDEYTFNNYCYMFVGDILTFFRMGQDKKYKNKLDLYYASSEEKIMFTSSFNDYNFCENKTIKTYEDLNYRLIKVPKYVISIIKNLYTDYEVDEILEKYETFENTYYKAHFKENMEYYYMYGDDFLRIIDIIDNGMNFNFYIPTLEERKAVRKYYNNYYYNNERPLRESNIKKKTLI